MSSIKEFIVTDRPCEQCGYNLNGLPKDGDCPECGRTIRRPSRGGPRAGTMSAEASPQAVTKLLIGFSILSISVIGMFIGSLIVPAAYQSSSASVRGAAGLAWIALHTLWPVGIWIATTPRQMQPDTVPDPIMDDDRLRLITRCCAVAFVLKAIIAVMYLQATTTALGVRAPANPPPLLLGARIALTAIAWIGFIPTSVYLGQIAYWASHETIGARLRTTAWAMSVFGLLSILTAAFMPMIALLLMLFTTIATLVFLISVLQITNVLRWVLKHQSYAAGSRDRVTERMNAQIERPGCISNGLICRKCKYNLNGLPFGGNCPECGTSYAELTPLPIRDPALSARDVPELDLAESTHQEILQYGQLDSLGHKKAADDDPDDGTIPLA